MFAGGITKPASYCSAALFPGTCGRGHGTQHECLQEGKEEKKGMLSEVEPKERGQMPEAV